MPFDVSRQSVQSFALAGQAQTQALVEGTILLPGVRQDNASILYTDGVIETGAIQIKNDRLALEGTVNFTVLYTGTEKRVQSAQASCAFSHVFEIPGASPELAARVSADLENITAEISGSKVTLRAVAALKAMMLRQQEESVLSYLNGTGIQTLDQEVGYTRQIGLGEQRMLFDAACELPAGLASEEVLYAKPTVNVVSATPSNDTVYLSGEVVMEVYHATTLLDRPMGRTVNAFPFEMRVELSGAQQEHLVQARVNAQDISVTLGEADENGQRAMNVEAVLVAKVEVEESVGAVLLKDAYATGDEGIKLQSAGLTVKSATFERSGMEQLRLTLTLPEDLPPLGAILACFARPVNYEIVDEATTQIMGVLEAVLLYRPYGSEEAEVLSASQEVPFEAKYGYALPENYEITLGAQDIEATQLASDQAEIRMNLYLKAKGDVMTRIDALTQAQPQENQLPEQSTISIYFVREGDTLWSVAKTYLTTVETLKRFNPDMHDLRTGDKLILLRKGSA